MHLQGQGTRAAGRLVAGQHRLQRGARFRRLPPELLGLLYEKGVDRLLVRENLFGAAVALALVVVLEVLAHRLLGLQLHVEVHGGVDLQPAGVEHLFAVALLEVAAHLLGEIGGVGDIGVDPRMDGQLLVVGLLRLFGGDGAVGDHALEDVLLALFGAIEVAIGGVAAGGARQAGEHGALGESQLLDVLVEVVFGRCLDTVGPVAEVDLVEVEVKDLLLGQPLLHPAGEDRLLELARVGALRSQQQALGHLLGDGAAALHDAASLEVFPGGTDDGDEVDPPVLVEIGILGGDEGLEQRLRHSLNGHDDAPLFRVLGNHLTVGAVDLGDDRRTIIGEGFHQRQRTCHVEVSPDQGRETQERAGAEGDEDITENGFLVDVHRRLTPLFYAVNLYNTVAEKGATAFAGPAASFLAPGR